MIAVAAQHPLRRLRRQLRNSLPAQSLLQRSQRQDLCRLPHTGKQQILRFRIHPAADSLWIRMQENTQEVLLPQPYHGLRRLFRNIIRLRNHQAPVVLPVHLQAVFQAHGIRSVREHIRGDDVESDLRLRQYPCRLLHVHAGHPGPLRLCVVQNGCFALVISVTDQRAHTVHVLHQHAEMPILRIVAVCIEMRRAVRIRKRFGGKGMRNIMIHAPHHEMICKVRLQPHAFRPAVIAEDLAHGSSVFARVNGCRTRGQTTEREMIEGAVPWRAEV